MGEAVGLRGLRARGGEVEMMLLLDDREAALLLRVIRNRLRELRVEVRHDRDSEARRYLQHKERILNRILAKFPEGMDEHAHMAGFELETSDVAR